MKYQPSGGERPPTSVYLAVFPHPVEPLVIAVTEPGACADCGADLHDQIICLFHPDAGFVCHDCAMERRGVLERCEYCGIWVQPGPEGIRLVAGGGTVHDCPASGHDVYRLCTNIWEERRYRALQEAA